MDSLRCKIMLKAVMAAPRPRALLDAIEKGGIKTLENAPEPPGGRPTSTLNITCKACPDEGFIRTARAYMEAPPASVILCAERLKDRDEMEEVLVHELVHVYDHFLAGKDLTDCNELAYSEVRAAREGECHYSDHVCSWFKKQCIKDAAKRSTNTLFPSQGSRCVDRVFDLAFKDTAPFPSSSSSPPPPQSSSSGGGARQSGTATVAVSTSSSTDNCSRRHGDGP